MRHMQPFYVHRPTGMSDGATMDLSTAMQYAKWAAIGLGAWWLISQIARSGRRY
jgi:hypothetical protein